mgnify:FL=1
MSIFNILFNGTNSPNLKLLLNNESFKNFISEAEDISIGYSEIRIFRIKNIQKEQKTHRKTQNEGWKNNWIIIGIDYLDDLLFVDCENQNLPVYISEHENRKWKMNLIANSIENFRKILSELKKLSIKRENPNLIDKNPISETEFEMFFSKIKKENEGIDTEYWQLFLEKDI